VHYELDTTHAVNPLNEYTLDLLNSTHPVSEVGLTDLEVCKLNCEVSEKEIPHLVHQLHVSECHRDLPIPTRLIDSHVIDGNCRWLTLLIDLDLSK
jgi:hypothetical protein